MSLAKEWEIDDSWTLFLDRDGVINQRINKGYVCYLDEFKFSPGVLESFSILARFFKKVVVVTNQQGIAKGLMTHDDLQILFDHIEVEAAKQGLKIEGFYVCPHFAMAGCDCRKPSTGMADQAKAQFPEIDFSKSVMVGDMMTDMKFGKGKGMKTAYLTNQRFFEMKFPDLIDFHSEELIDFAKAL